MPALGKDSLLWALTRQTAPLPTLKPKLEHWGRRCGVAGEAAIVMLPSHVLAAPLSTQLLLMAWEKQGKMVQVSGPLPKILVGDPDEAPGFGLAQLWLLEPLGE